MELNTRYLQSEFPIENLSAGTVIEVFYTEEYKEENGSLVLITESGGIWDRDGGGNICAISINNGGYFIEQRHSVEEYEIKRL